MGSLKFSELMTINLFLRHPREMEIIPLEEHGQNMTKMDTLYGVDLSLNGRPLQASEKEFFPLL